MSEKDVDKNLVGILSTNALMIAVVPSIPFRIPERDDHTPQVREMAAKTACKPCIIGSPLAFNNSVGMLQIHTALPTFSLEKVVPC